MMARRRNPSTAGPWVHTPSASGPRCFRAVFIRRTACSSGAVSHETSPAIPHTQALYPNIGCRSVGAEQDMANKARLRVMHVVVAGDIGGAERLLVELATRPERTGADHEVALITPNRALATHLTGAGLHVHDRGHARENRSEERRVGKECRSRWSPYH